MARRSFFREPLDKLEAYCNGKKRKKRIFKEKRMENNLH
ncbi:hypothetical protein CCACVL1_15217 [Corchorus capsularis]|uniref:Uncharacterized protein n=1 Tax=Corchorus capsularis TaxID=210143 RepID=A0A1R3I3G5_COCAP|nr:hypothetical protein CCACVL1_15217 [Corchorus capsularis]